MNNNRFPGYYANHAEHQLQSATRRHKKQQLLKTVAPLEINDDFLWFKGYSIYLTAWSKKYLATLVFDPSFDFSKPFSIKPEYVKMTHIWHCHHWELSQRHMPYANPPMLVQFEDAVKFFEVKQIINCNRKTPGFLDLNRSEILRFLNFTK